MNKVLKNSFWNIIGVTFYYFCQWLINVLVVRLSGSFEEAGVLSVALTTSTIFGTVSSFSVRPFQVADIDNKFSNSEYLTFRYATSLASLLILFIYLAVIQYNLYTSMAILCCMLIKITEYLCDVTEGVFQKQWRLDLACKSYVIRGLLYVTVFSVVEFISKNLVAALFFSLLTQLVCFIFFNLFPCCKLNKIKVEFKNKRLIDLLKKTFPLFIHGILISVISNIPRLFAKEICGEEALGYYASIAAVAYAVQLVSYVAFSPLIPLLSESFKKKTKKIYVLIAEAMGIIAVFGFTVIVGINLFGEFAYKLLFGESILQYFYLAIPSFITCILAAYVLFLTDLYVVINKNNIKVAIEAVCTVLTVVLTPVFIRNWDLQGINWSMITVYAFFIILGSGILFYNIRKNIMDTKNIT